MPVNARRVGIIDKIIGSLIKIEKENLDLDEKALLSEVCAEFGCSWRTAREYVKIAKEKIRIAKANGSY